MSLLFLLASRSGRGRGREKKAARITSIRSVVRANASIRKIKCRRVGGCGMKFIGLFSCNGDERGRGSRLALGIGGRGLFQFF